eukprot:TRINITY_DN1078_c1_g1_i2.p2 TRINITY_DN1078_c1_g1~~TRINITY_DN1078_c1_g1_i2.p2  ORF type:complete len:233 (+),score=40.30 TRINITY_DN1078_c1_g1_i2:968-1666(+)
MERTPKTFKIPKISVSDDQVRNSIVMTGDEVGFDSPASPGSSRARGATFSSRPVGQVFEKPLTVEEMLGGGRPPPLQAVQENGSPRISFDNLGKKTPVGSPKSPISFTSPETASPPSTVNFNRMPQSPVLTDTVTRKARASTTLTKPPDFATTEQSKVKNPASPTIIRTSHVFKRKHWNIPHWCFYCGKCIYGVGKQGFSCILCECPVHVKCVDSSSQLSCCEQYLNRQQLK